jgi:ssDNA-binding Zn-finger/Zn-ribbon topoisomerase 1
MSINAPISCNIGENNITLVFIGHAPFTLRKNQHDENKLKRFEEIKSKIINAMERGNSDVNWEEIRSMFIPKLNVSEVIGDEERNNFKSGRLVCKDNRFYYRGYELKNYLVKRILEIKRESDESGQEMKHMIKPMLHFLDNLMENPSSNSVSQLYRFVEHTKMPITEDGCLLAYKIIRQNYTDKYTGKFDNSIGAVVEMERNQVVDDPHKTCSSGLHFSSYNYATGFFNDRNSDRMVVIKINPADVVSIPVDYNNEKGRCSKYEVLYEIPMEEVLKDDVLGIYEDDESDDYDINFEDSEFDIDDESYCPDCGEVVNEDDDECPDCGETL